MASHTEPATHPVLLAIAAAAFVVLLVLGVDLHGTQSGHSAAEHDKTASPNNAH